MKRTAATPTRRKVPEADAMLWADLIAQLCEAHHDGHYYAMARRLRCQPSKVYQWRDGTTARPSLEGLLAVCRAYHLPFETTYRRLFPERDAAESGPLRGIMSLSRQVLVYLSWLRSAEPQPVGCAG